ncbi:MAG: flippase-like domain-containing protein [Alphaproteobacteria bacterium]|nr:flippase-like domain-containing protein [Alphaproteobacteria bacterium]
MIRMASLLGLLGLVAATLLIARSGYDEVMAALGQAGWGILITSLFHLVPLWACVMGWQPLLPGKVKAGKPFFMYVLWIRASVNNLMPVARIGGEILSVRLMIKHGIRKAPSIASTVVEITLSILAQFVFVLIGVAFFVLRVSNENLGMQLLWGLLITAPAVGALFTIQKVGLFGLFEKIFGLLLRDKWKKFAGSGAKLDHAVRTMYRRRGKAFACFMWQFASWALCSFEIWLALYYLGHPISLLEAMMIESLIQATSTAAFAVPGALGVQEAGFMLFGSMLGLTPDIAAALAVVRRCRDLILYVPGLLVWQIQESRWLLQARKQELRKPPAAS